MEGHGTLASRYGAYKDYNGETRRCTAGWGLHSVGLRPGVVYGVGRDQGLTSKTTVAIVAAASGKPYSFPRAGFLVARW